MEKNEILLYEAASIQVIEIRIEGLVCQSQNTMDNRNGYDTTDDNPFAG